MSAVFMFLKNKEYSILIVFVFKDTPICPFIDNESMFISIIFKDSYCAFKLSMLIVIFKNTVFLQTSYDCGNHKCGF